MELAKAGALAVLESVVVAVAVVAVVARAERVESQHGRELGEAQRCEVVADAVRRRVRERREQPRACSDGMSGLGVVTPTSNHRAASRAFPPTERTQRRDRCVAVIVVASAIFRAASAKVPSAANQANPAKSAAAATAAAAEPVAAPARRRTDPVRVVEARLRARPHAQRDGRCTLRVVTQ